jgi:hypothetical protein
MRSLAAAVLLVASVVIVSPAYAQRGLNELVTHVHSAKEQTCIRSPVRHVCDAAFNKVLGRIYSLWAQMMGEMLLSNSSMLKKSPRQLAREIREEFNTVRSQFSGPDI